MKQPPIKIIGAGFSGLSIAYYLVKMGFRDITIYERREEVGGLVKSHTTPYGIAEQAANGILATDRLEDLLRSIKVKALAPSKESKKRFILKGLKKRQWPIGIYSSLVFLVFIFKYLFFKSSVRPWRFETIHDWSLRVLNKEILDFLLAPALQGIYAGEPHKMSATLLFGKYFKKLPKRRGSLRGTISSADGIGGIIKGLKEFCLAHDVKFVFQENTTIDSSAITILATNAHCAGEILQKTYPDLAQALQNIELLPITTTTVFWNKLSDQIPGFGVLFPRSEGVKALGVLANTKIFNRGPAYSETWIYKGALENNSETIKSFVLTDRRLFMNAPEPDYLFFKVWDKSIPHYTIELEKLLESMEDLENIYLTGNYLGNIGLSGILDQNYLLSQKIVKTHG